MDLKSCQAVHPGFTQGMSPQSIAMSLNSAIPSQALHQPQPPNLTLFGAANLQGKATTPLTHIGFVSPNLQSAMLHLTRQSQEQSGIGLPQNHFNQGTVPQFTSPMSVYYTLAIFERRFVGTFIFIWWFMVQKLREVSALRKK